MPGIKVTDIAWGRLRSPDLDLQEQFLLDFGMVRAARTKNALYMRGTDPNHHLHVTELGEPKFLGFAYYAASEEDLDRLSRAEGASQVEAIDEPGAGKRVRLEDPHGYQIEVVWGQDKVEPLPVRPNTLNWGLEKYRRSGDLCRLARGPSQVKRIGHGVLMTTDLGTALRWYRDRLGFVSSNDIYIGDPANVIASFNRCDRGEDFVDHHVFFCMQGDKIGLNHLSYEVQDFDDVMMGHEYLAATKKYGHYWGIGRHLLGSQVYDYWGDPWQRVHEHWTDSDVLNIHNGSHPMTPEEGFKSQWGEPPPAKFIQHAVP
jgi:catechol 2,3-dioxygenase-like lactoylglutathione lyase family enzyme